MGDIVSVTRVGLVRKGVLLAGGTGSRLFPLTVSVNKHVLPIHDKPMIYYPLSTLLLGGIREILIVSSAEHLRTFERLFGDGSWLGVRFEYAEQVAPRGIADALLVAEPFLAGEGCVLALGDNIVWGPLDFLRSALRRPTGATIFAFPVQDPSQYGVVTLNDQGRAVALEEKPARPRSRLAVPGLYAFDGRAAAFAREIEPSPRGELEILDVCRRYQQRGELDVITLGRGTAWLDMGTSDALLQASQFVATIEQRQGLSIGCLEECALRMGFQTPSALRARVEAYPVGKYRDYVEALLDAEPVSKGSSKDHREADSRVGAPISAIG
jgi:glucose-1-phosphate thymidylyltransferase